MKNKVIIDNKIISDSTEPYIIAEVSANHNGSLQTALDTLLAAKQAGASAVKIQSYTPDTMTIDCHKKDFMIEGGLWDGENLYSLYEKAHTPFAWHQTLFNYAKEIDITLFSTPFDNTAVDLLESLGCPAYKIASFEITDIPLIKRIAQTGKPIIISTGLANLDEVEEAVEAIKEQNNHQIIILHCISAYPTPVEKMNLKSIITLQNHFNLLTGLSDHSIGSAAANTAVALGARVIEKHFILDRNQGGPDSTFSIEPSELTELINTCNQTWLSLGSGDITTSNEESPNKKFRRSIYAVKNIPKGHIISEEDVRVIRPGFGLAPKYIDKVIGSKATIAIEKGTPISLNFLNNSALKDN